jgi:hypothetical protein
MLSNETIICIFHSNLQNNYLKIHLYEKKILGQKDMHSF